MNSTSKGVKITKEGSNYNISFKNTAYAYGAIKNGYIDIDGEKFVLGDKEKSELKKAADKAFNQMQQDTLTATIEHNAHVLKQQAEAIRNAESDELKLLNMLLSDKEEEEWVTPLKQLQNHTVSMDIEKTQDGFELKEVTIQTGSSGIFD